MLEFTCSTCGKRVQGDDASAGQHVLCPACNATMTAPQPTQADVSPASAIATPEHAPKAKVTPRTDSSAGSFSEGEPPRQHDSPLPPVGQEGQPSLRRGCAGGLLTGLFFAVLGLFLGCLSAGPSGGGPTGALPALFRGFWGAAVGGIFGLIAGYLYWSRRPRATLTSATLGALIGAAIGCVGGFVIVVLFATRDVRPGNEFTAHLAGGFVGSMAVGFLGFIIGASFGSQNAARKQKEKEGSAARQPLKDRWPRGRDRNP